MVCANFAHTTSLRDPVSMAFSRKERKVRKGVGMGRRVSARPLAAPSGFARTLLRLCFAKLLASLVGGPDGFAAGASRAQATRRLPAASRPLPLRLSFVVCRPSSNVHEVTGLFQWFSRKGRKERKGVGASSRTSPRSTRFPRAAEFPIDCKRNFMV